MKIGKSWDRCWRCSMNIESLSHKNGLVKRVELIYRMLKGIHAAVDQLPFPRTGYVAHRPRYQHRFSQVL